MASEVTVKLRRPHEQQQKFLDCKSPRVVVCAGRRGGKTTGIAIKAVQEFLKGRRVLYSAPTTDQVDAFWNEVKNALRQALEEGIFYKSEVRHIIEFPGTRQRIRAKAAWNADTLRGDSADFLILDEWQLMDESAWEIVGAPMLLDNNGDAVFIYTPPSFRSAGVSKARDKKHASKMFERAKADTTGRWEAFHFTSLSNPHISEDALAEIADDMTPIAYKQEILAENIDHIPGALWTPTILSEHRVHEYPPLKQIVVGVDPQGKKGGAETGIVVVGLGENDDLYVLEDCSIDGTPTEWGQQVVDAYERWEADYVVPEKNQGGDMVESTIHNVDGSVPVKMVHASRGKYTRAEPVSVRYTKGEVHHVGTMPLLEEEMCSWLPGSESPNRIDALVHACARFKKSRKKVSTSAGNY